jgi:mono/diheme cytochrome c family protein
VALLVVAGWGLYLLANVRRAKPEVGSEIELAANRRQYYDDEQLEGRRLDQVLRWGLISLSIIGVGLPLYWLAEPGRQSGAVSNFEEIFVERGAHLFAPTDQGGFNCAGCHGGALGLGGEVPYTLTEYEYDENGEIVRDEDGNPETTLRQVSWRAPALNTVALRMTEDQIRQVLVYGRPFSPMPAWGIEGGGPMNEQQIDNLIAYLQSIAISPEEAQQQAQEEAEAEVERLATLQSQLREEQAKDEPDEELVARLEREISYNQPATLGAALFNLNCARCHTSGWSYDEPEAPGGGAMGPSLYNELTQFPDETEHYDWVANGTDVGEQYGQYGQNDSGAMPYFGRQLTREQIQAIVNYERELSATGPPSPEVRNDVNDTLRAPTPRAGSEPSPAGQEPTGADEDSTGETGGGGA